MATEGSTEDFLFAPVRLYSIRDPINTLGLSPHPEEFILFPANAETLNDRATANLVLCRHYR